MVHTRAGSGSRNLGGSSSRCPQHTPQKMLPHSRQWCRSRVSALRQRGRTPLSQPGVATYRFLEPLCLDLGTTAALHTAAARTRLQPSLSQLSHRINAEIPSYLSIYQSNNTGKGSYAPPGPPPPPQMHT